MPGKMCPECGHSTLFQFGNQLKCNNPICRCVVSIPPNEGKGGRGKLCSNCGYYKVFNNLCNGCGAKVTR